MFIIGEDFKELKEVLGVQIQTFAADDGFFVDIVIDNPKKMYDAWIYHEDYGIKEYMFGSAFEQNRYGEFFELVCANVEDYKETYRRFREEEDTLA